MKKNNKKRKFVPNFIPGSLFPQPYTSDEPYGGYIFDRNMQMVCKSELDKTLKAAETCNAFMRFVAAAFNNAYDSGYTLPKEIAYPFRAEKDHIYDVNGLLVLCIRGWGYLTSVKCFSPKIAAEVQNKMAVWAVNWMNAYVEILKMCKNPDVLDIVKADKAAEAAEVKQC